MTCRRRSACEVPGSLRYATELHWGNGVGNLRNSSDVPPNGSTLGSDRALWLGVARGARAVRHVRRIGTPLQIEGNFSSRSRVDAVR